ncbi:hypothetical protein NDU88_002033 [Pleurodeles waltl]|uniref:Uncharacterized protein n=1 Tax=Pleurodeles waltl TaxID=8319 RepID=A0AAV7WK42_PLEWA|nr:hypothetical protein NDU88_002033 [Pleurodeles waltl]
MPRGYVRGCPRARRTSSVSSPDPEVLCPAPRKGERLDGAGLLKAPEEEERRMQPPPQDRRQRTSRPQRWKRKPQHSSQASNVTTRRQQDAEDGHALGRVWPNKRMTELQSQKTAPELQRCLIDIKESLTQHENDKDD